MDYACKAVQRLWEVCISLAADLYLGLYFTFVAVVLRVSEQQQQPQSHWKWARSSVHPIWLNFPGFSGAVLHYTSSCSFDYLLYICRKKMSFPCCYRPLFRSLLICHVASCYGVNSYSSVRAGTAVGLPAAAGVLGRAEGGLFSLRGSSRWLQGDLSVPVSTSGKSRTGKELSH